MMYTNNNKHGKAREDKKKPLGSEASSFVLPTMSIGSIFNPSKNQIKNPESRFNNHKLISAYKTKKRKRKDLELRIIKTNKSFRKRKGKDLEIK